MVCIASKKKQTGVIILPHYSPIFGLNLHFYFKMFVLLSLFSFFSFPNITILFCLYTIWAFFISLLLRSNRSLEVFSEVLSAFMDKGNAPLQRVPTLHNVTLFLRHMFPGQFSGVQESVLIPSQTYNKQNQFHEIQCLHFLLTFH